MHYRTTNIQALIDRIDELAQDWTVERDMYLALNRLRQQKAIHTRELLKAEKYSELDEVLAELSKKHLF